MKPFAAAAGALTFAFVAFTGVAQAQNADNNVPPVDTLFAQEAATMNQAEIQLSQKVVDHEGITAPVKGFAQEMIDDHKKAGDQLKQLADKNDMSLPDGMNTAHSNFSDALDNMNGADFERAYMQAMVMDHMLAITLFEGQSKSGNNAELKQFASQTLPILQQHLQKAQNIQKTLAGAGSAHLNGAQPVE